MTKELEGLVAVNGPRPLISLYDEDDMSSNSADGVPTQQSLVAFNGAPSGTSHITSSGAATFDPNYNSVLVLEHTSQITVTIAAPVAGGWLYIVQTDAGTAGHTVTLTAGTWDGSNNVATLNAQDEALLCVGLSATRYLIVENYGSVGLS